VSEARGAYGGGVEAFSRAATRFRELLTARVLPRDFAAPG
jgi:hypothetical protein